MARPFVLLSAAMSVDGCIDDTAPEPLLLSDAADLDRVDEVRAGVDAILVGATTVRRDNPRLLVRSAERRAARVAAGRPPDPLKVTLTASGRPRRRPRASSRPATAEKLVYAATGAVEQARAAVGAAATVVDAGAPIDLPRLLADLRERGVERLMVEGGSAVHTMFLTAGLADELHLVVAPFFVGDARGTAVRRAGPVPAGRRAPHAPRRGAPDRRPGAPAVRAGPADADEPVDEPVDDRRLLARAVALAAQLPAVGHRVLRRRARRRRHRRGARRGLVADARAARPRRGGRAPLVGPRLVGAGPGTTVYSSLEPCSARASRPRTCTELILAAGVQRVVFAWREPAVFVDGDGRRAAAGRGGGRGGAARARRRRPRARTGISLQRAALRSSGLRRVTGRPRPAVVATLFRVLTRMSSLFLRTLREDPADAEVPSHKLLVRAGYVRRVAPGIYSWLPLGLRVLRAIEQVVREEMDAIGAQEIHLPALLPKEPYEATGRWTEYGPNIFRLKDRRGGDYLLGPTHEELFTQLVKGEYASYKDYPVMLYQIQTKYRDEARPRAGILRGREFLMKDSYSFDLADEGLAESYRLHRAAYVRIFERLGHQVRDRQGHVGRHGWLGVGGVPRGGAHR